MCSADLVTARFEKSLEGTWGHQISALTARRECAYLGGGMAFGSHLAPYVMVEEEGFGGIVHSMRKQTTTGTKRNEFNMPQALGL